MKNTRARGGLSVLALRFTVLPEPDRPAVDVLVDGERPFAAVAPDWRGFDPTEILGNDSPLLPPDLGRRVAVQQCSCGIAGCGVIAPVIVPSPDRKRISWVDFRDYTGVFGRPVSDSVSRCEGTPWDLPDLHFDRDQYLAEVERASRDDSWETPRRRTARLLHDRLTAMDLVLPPGLRLRWVSPAWNSEGVEVGFSRPRGYDTRVLRLTSSRTDPAEAAADMAGRLAATSPADRVRRFDAGADRRHGRKRRR